MTDHAERVRLSMAGHDLGAFGQNTFCLHISDVGD